MPRNQRKYKGGQRMTHQNLKHPNAKKRPRPHPHPWGQGHDPGLWGVANVERVMGLKHKKSTPEKKGDEWMHFLKKKYKCTHLGLPSILQTNASKSSSSSKTWGGKNEEVKKKYFWKNTRKYEYAQKENVQEHMPSISTFKIWTFGENWKVYTNVPK